MKKNFVHYYYFISCPSDIKEELGIVSDVINEINNTLGEDIGINIKCLHWKESATPQSGNSGQNIINKQLGDKADGVIAFMWTKFGTPTVSYGSGTEEEIERAIIQNKNVMLYFCDKPINPSTINMEQYQRVLSFKEKYDGLFSSYSSIQDFRKMFNRHMMDLFSKLSLLENNNEDNSTTFTLTELLECGWFIRRFLVELPTEKRELDVFLERLNVIIRLSIEKGINIENDLTDFKIHLIKNNLSGLKQSEIENIRKLLWDSEISFMKKLESKQNATFQLGRSLGQCCLMLEMVWSNDENALLADCINEFDNALTNFMEQALQCSKSIHDNIFVLVYNLNNLLVDPNTKCVKLIESFRLTTEKIATRLPLIN